MKRPCNPTNKGKVYKFTHLENESVEIETQSGKDLVPFECDWLKIEGKTITIKGEYHKGYAWDGASPKLKVAGLYIGTPDGSIDPKTGKPRTYFATMFHDALYQYKSLESIGNNCSCKTNPDPDERIESLSVPMTRADADVLFLLLMEIADFKLKGVYDFFVTRFGKIYGKWDFEEQVGIIAVKSYSWKAPKDPTEEPPALV